jgi:small GTP-binding protein
LVNDLLNEEKKFLKENKEYIQANLKIKQKFENVSENWKEINFEKIKRNYYYPIQILEPPNSELPYPFEDNIYAINLVLIGSSTVGKTCFISSFMSSMFINTLSSVGYTSFSTWAKFENEIVSIRFWDTTGQERFKSLPQNLYNKADGMLVLFDVTQRDTYNSASNWIEDIRRHRGTGDNLNKKVKNEVLYLIGNKIDLVEKRDVSREEGKELAKKYDLNYFETSCKDGINLYAMIYRLIYDCLPYRKPGMKIKKEKKKKQSSCKK